MPLNITYLPPFYHSVVAYGNGDERIIGSPICLYNYLYGANGDDTIRANGLRYSYLAGGNGNDVLYGSPCGGYSDLYGGDGDDRLYGGGGNDNLFGGRGDDTMNGGDGNDTIKDSYGNNWISGGAGDDTITTSLGTQSIFGGSGNDRITAAGALSGTDILGGSGSDTIDASGFGVRIWGEDGNDKITFRSTGLFTDSSVDGGDGDDDITIAGNDVNVIGGAGADTIDIERSKSTRVTYFSFRESPAGSAGGSKQYDTIYGLNSYENLHTVDLSSLNFEAGRDLYWANANDHRPGAVHLFNYGQRADLYAYGQNNAAFRLHFEGAYMISHSEFMI